MPFSLIMLIYIIYSFYDYITDEKNFTDPNHVQIEEEPSQTQELSINSESVTKSKKPTSSQKRPKKEKEKEPVLLLGFYVLQGVFPFAIIKENGKIKHIRINPNEYHVSGDFMRQTLIYKGKELSL
jgi:hypothetical protein